MNRRVSLTVSLLMLVVSAVTAQVIDPSFTDLFNKIELNKILEGGNQGYTGSPYLEQEFFKGDIHMANGVIYHDIPLRYNVYNDIFEFEIEGQAFALDESKNYSRIEMGGRSFILTSYTYGQATRRGHLEVVAAGNYSILKKYKVELLPPQPPAAYKEAKAAGFKNLKPDYFLKKEDADAIFFNNEKSLSRICSCNSDKLKSFTRSNSLNFKEEESLKIIAQYLNNE